MICFAGQRVEYQFEFFTQRRYDMLSAEERSAFAPLRAILFEIKALPGFE